MNRQILITLFVLLLCSTARADIAVIVNIQNNVSYNDDQVRKVFLSKIKSFPNGEKIQTYTMPIGSKERQEFVGALIQRSEASLHSYWSRILFSAKGRPPKRLDKSEQMKATVANDPRAIGYIDATEVDSSIRVVAIFSKVDGILVK